MDLKRFYPEHCSQRSGNRRYSKKIRLAALLLAGTSLLSMPATSVFAQTTLNKTTNGTNGKNAVSGWGTSWDAATPGGNAAAISETAEIIYDAILLTSKGGQGGIGGSGYFVNAPGAPGGAGGAITLSTTFEVSLNNNTAAPAVLLQTIGGNGGTGWHPHGAGGVGGNITANINSGVYTYAAKQHGIYAVSQGGNSADPWQFGGTSEARKSQDAGGAGGTVTINILPQGVISTDAASSPAIYASSLGGKGGKGGDGRVTKAWPSNGGEGRDVNVTVEGKVTTSGANSTAIIAQSIGGNGGETGAIGMGDGVSGSNGGKSGTVTVVNAGNIQTSENYSFGIAAQSVGGSAGRGGGSSLWNGGAGGTGGSAGNVVITNTTGTIRTEGVGSVAIFGQSLAGGFALDAFHAEDPKTASESGGDGGEGGFLGKGGSGGGGGAAGQVTVTVGGEGSNIRTDGDSAYGVHAQSIGGSGGTGGDTTSRKAFIAIALGGAGGFGGHGGNVTINDPSTGGGVIETSGKNAAAILAQSIGGGGGAGGKAIATSGGVGLSAAVAIGGSGGDGGNGGTVSVTSQNTIITHDENAPGILAISTGGGGGTGGLSQATSVSLPLVTPSGTPLPAVALAVSVGGSGGKGGRGSNVTVNNSGVINTYGAGSTGIEGKSIGGGGGDTGSALSYALAVPVPGATGISAAVSIGGSGGEGGEGSPVTISHKAGKIVTQGVGAVGISGQSIGGGGGSAAATAATSNSVSTYRNIDLSTTIGGSGGNGGNGARVSVSLDNGALVETHDNDSIGILVKSIGGGGGDAGSIRSTAASGLSFNKVLDGLVQQVPLADSVTINVGIGGSGGTGGHGSQAVVNINDSDSKIRTYGANSSGIVAQSIGGGGGIGGGGSVPASGTMSVAVSVGGKGGQGGVGNTVTVTNNGTIYTEGSASHAIFAQSIGGGGGIGGSMAAENNTKNDSIAEIWSALQEAVGIEAFDQWVKANGTEKTKEKLKKFITDIQDTEKFKQLSDKFKSSDFYKNMQTTKTKITNWSDAQKRQAISQPSVSLTVSLGGSGGSGNLGGTVNVTTGATSSIITKGDASYGILAQSNGGGGGIGGTAYGNGASKTNVVATIGGSGGEGATGGVVTVTQGGTIRTEGLASHGIFAQSVGGGGGIGVAAFSSDNKKGREDKNITISATIGGNGGTGGNGNRVSVVNTGNIITAGDEAFGIKAQSVGGGGGAFVMNPSKAGEASKETQASESAEEASDDLVKDLLAALDFKDLPTISEISTLIFSKSLGVTLGGSGKAAGNGGNVTVTHGGNIETDGKAAHGIFAQSVGGGGGTSNAATSVSGIKYVASFGGTGGAAGTGGRIDITLNENATIKTSGDRAAGIYAQSIGGGGGYASQVLLGNATPLYQRAGGAGGNGGAINIASTGKVAITTSGEKAHGIFAQSIGGGGGTAPQGMKVEKYTSDVVHEILSRIEKLPATGLIRDNMASIPEKYRDTVSMLFDEKKSTQAAVDYLKQLISSNTPPEGVGGTITIKLNGDIKTEGADSYGIFAQSGSQDMDGNLYDQRNGRNIDIHFAGTLSGGNGDGAGIAVDGGLRNRIEIAEGAKVSALSGKAIIASFGNDTLVNRGSIIGDIDLSTRTSSTLSESNAFENYGYYQSSEKGLINLLAKSKNKHGTFSNHGTINIGGLDKTGTLTITADKVTLGGELLVNVDSLGPNGSPINDQLIIDGLSETSVSGLNIKPTVGNGLLQDTFKVISQPQTASGKAITGEATIAQREGSPIVWNVSSTGQDVSVTPTAKFIERAAFRKTETHENVLNSLQNVWNSNNKNSAPIFAQFANIETQDQYYKMVENLAAPARNAEPAYDQMLDARSSLNAAMSCPLFEGDTTNLRENSCAWGKITGSRSARFAGGDGESTKQTEIDYRVGAQWEIKPNWFLGASAAYVTSKMSTGNKLTHIDSEGGEASIALKYQSGPWLFAGAIHGGYLSNESTNRFYQYGIAGLQQSINNDVITGAVRLRAAYEYAFSDWYVRPFIDVDVIHNYMSSYTIQAAGYVMHVKALRDWNFAIAPSVEVGGRVDLGEHGWLRPYASVGAVFMSGHRGEDLEKQVTFSTGNGYGIQYTSSVEVPDLMLDARAGVQFFANDQFEIRGEYKAQVGEKFLSHEGSLRLGVKF